MLNKKIVTISTAITIGVSSVAAAAPAAFAIKIYKIKSGKLVHDKNDKVVKGFKTYNKKLYKNGRLFTGLKGGKFYKAGKLGTGQYKGVKYVNGKRFTGMTKTNKYFKNGVAGTGVYKGTYYKKGVRSTGTYKGIYYQNGKKFTGFAEKTGLYYKNGKLFSGPKKRVRYYKGEKFTGISQANKLAYQAGHLFTGIFALDGKRYVDGKLFTGISPEDGAKYENGVIVDGSIVVENQDRYGSSTSFGSEIGLADTMWEFSDTQLKSFTTEDVKKWVTVPANTILEVSYSKALSQVKPGDLVTITFIAINQGQATMKKIMIKVVTEQTAFESALNAYELALKAASDKKVEVVTVNTDTASLAELKLAIEKMNEMIANLQKETAQEKEKDKVIKAYEEMLRAANDAKVNVNEFKINTDTASLAEIKEAIEKMNEAIAKAKGTLAEETAQALKAYEEALKAANDAKVNINEFKINKDTASLAEIKIAIEKMNEAVTKSKQQLAEERAKALKLYEEALKAANDANVIVNEFKINKDAASVAEIKAATDKINELVAATKKTVDEERNNAIKMYNTTLKMASDAKIVINSDFIISTITASIEEINNATNKINDAMAAAKETKTKEEREIVMAYTDALKEANTVQADVSAFIVIVSETSFSEIKTATEKIQEAINKAQARNALLLATQAVDVNKYQDVVKAQQLLDDAKAIYNDTKKSKADYEQAKTSLEASISNLTPKTFSSEAWEKISRYISYNSLLDVPTAKDYEALNIQIDSNTLVNAINETLIKLKPTNKDDVSKIASALKKVLGSEATFAEYGLLGIDLKGLNVNLLNNTISEKDIKTLKELESTINALMNITLTNGATAQDYKNIVGLDVPAENLEIFRAKLKDNNISTLTALKTTFNEVQTTLETIFSYAKGYSNIEPSLATYQFLNFDVGGLSADTINAAIRGNEISSVAELSTLLKKLPEAFNALLYYAKGGNVLTATQYNTLGFNVDEYGGLENLNDQLKNSQVTSTEAAQERLAALRELIQYITNDNKNNLNLSEENLKKLLDATSSELGADNIEALLKNARITNLRDLRERIAAFRWILNFTNASSLENWLGSNKPTLEVYTKAGFDVGNIDISVLNRIVGAKNLSGFTILKDTLLNAKKSWELIQDYKDNEHLAPTPTLEDYQNIGVKISLHSTVDILNQILLSKETIKDFLEI